MKLLFTGGRKYSGVHAFTEAMKSFPYLSQIDFTIQGGARGADTVARQWSEYEGIYSVTLDALWHFHGNKAGPHRNQKMLDLFKPDYCIALPGGTGTADMVRRCRLLNMPVWEPLG